MSDGSKKVRSYLYVQLLIVLLLIISTPVSSYSAKMAYTVQLGSHLGESESMQQFESVMKLLSEEERHFLRIEQIGGYYAVRVGRFTNSVEAKKFLAKARTIYSDSVMMIAYISYNRLVKMYRPAPVETLVPAPFETKEPPIVMLAEPEVVQSVTAEAGIPESLEREEIDVQVVKAEEGALNEVEIEASAPVTFESPVSPRTVVEEPTTALSPIVVEETAPVSLEQHKSAVEVPQVADKLLDTVNPELKGDAVVALVETTQEASQAVIAEQLSDAPAEVKSAAAIVEEVSPVKPVAEADKGVDVADRAQNSVTLRQLTIYASAVLIFVLIFVVRTRKKVKELPQSDAPVEETNAPEIKQLEQTSAKSNAEPLQQEEVATAGPLENSIIATDLDRDVVAVAEEVSPEAVEVVTQLEELISTDNEVASVVELEPEGSDDNEDRLDEAAYDLRESEPGEDTSTVAEIVDQRDVAVSDPAPDIMDIESSASTELVVPENEPVKEERQNRVSRAMEAAVFGLKDER